MLYNSFKINDNLNDIFSILIEINDIKDCKKWLKEYLTIMSVTSKKPCIIVDIDGTILFLNGLFKIIKIPLMKGIIKMCKKCNIDVFLLTSRINVKIPVDENDNCLMNRDLTELQLEKLDIKIDEYKELIMMPLSVLENESNVSGFKYRERFKIKEQGYNILLNIGDNWSDLFVIHPCKLINENNENKIRWMKKTSEKIMTELEWGKIYLGDFPDFSWICVKLPTLYL